MRFDDGPSPDKGMARQRLDRVRAAVRTAPFPVKIVLVFALLAAAVLASAVPGWVGSLALILALCYGPIAVWRKQRSVFAAAHAPVLARNFVPCRTVAWTLLWAVPGALLAWRFAPGQHVLSWVIGWLLAVVVLGWRLARSLQDSRVYGRQQARSPSVT